MNHEADAWVGQARRRSRPAPCDPEPHPRSIDIQYPILSEATLLHRWNLSPKALQRWSAEGIGPPAWRIGKHPRYLVCEVERFERTRSGPTTAPTTPTGCFAGCSTAAAHRR